METRRSLRQGFAKGTRINLRIQKRRYLQFCARYKLQAFPATTGNLCLYAQFLAKSFRSPHAITNYLFGVKTIHILRGLDTLAFDSRILKILITGIRRRMAHMVKQALPITPKILGDMRQFLNVSSVHDSVFWAISLLAFFTVCRKSNLVPNTAARFDPAKQLTRGSISSGKQGLLVSLGWTKTIQFGHRRLNIPVVPIKGSLLCPVRAYKTMCRLIPAPDAAPAFAIPVNGSLQPYTYRAWMARLRQLLSRTGRRADKFSCHSFRRGGATFAFQAGVPSEMVKLLGDWRSECYQKYLHFPLESKTRAALTVAEFLKQSYTP